MQAVIAQMQREIAELKAEKRNPSYVQESASIPTNNPVAAPNILNGCSGGDITTFGSLQCGTGADASAGNSVAVGRIAVASESSAVALGYQADATASRSIGIGALALASGERGIAIGSRFANDTGDETTASGEGSLAIGSYTLATGEGAISVGAFRQCIKHICRCRGRIFSRFRITSRNTWKRHNRVWHNVDGARPFGGRHTN